jgi:RNA polymerase-binding transcription factor DksA
MNQPSEPEGTGLAPVAVLGVVVDVFPSLDDAAVTERVRRCARAQGMDYHGAARFAAQAAAIIGSFEFGYCESCGRDLDEHKLYAGPLGNAHARCLADEAQP